MPLGQSLGMVSLAAGSQWHSRRRSSATSGSGCTAPLKGPSPRQVAAALAAVVTETIDVEDEGRSWVRTDHNGQRDLIRTENERAGTTGSFNTRVDPKTKYRCPWIDMTAPTPAWTCDLLSIMVSTNPASPFVLDIYRLGYYGGKGGRHLLRSGTFQGCGAARSGGRRRTSA